MPIKPGQKINAAKIYAQGPVSKSRLQELCGDNGIFRRYERALGQVYRSEREQSDLISRIILGLSQCELRLQAMTKSGKDLQKDGAQLPIFMAVALPFAEVLARLANEPPPAKVIFEQLYTLRARLSSIEDREEDTYLKNEELAQYYKDFTTKKVPTLERRRELSEAALKKHFKAVLDRLPYADIWERFFLAEQAQKPWSDYESHLAVLSTPGFEANVLSCSVGMLQELYGSFLVVRSTTEECNSQIPLFRNFAADYILAPGVEGKPSAYPRAMDDLGAFLAVCSAQLKLSAVGHPEVKGFLPQRGGACQTEASGGSDDLTPAEWAQIRAMEAQELRKLK